MMRHYYYHRNRSFTATATTLSSSKPTVLDATGDKTSSLSGQQLQYLHVGPSGDCWTGDSIFAAKHLQPNYVKSIPLLMMKEETFCVDTLLEALEDNEDWGREIYDTEEIPSKLKEFLLNKQQQELVPNK